MKPALLLRHAGPARGKIVLPGDKSIAHRFLIVGALSSNKITIENFPANKDCLATLDALKKFGIKISFLNKNKTAVSIQGKGLRGLKKPAGPVFVGDSGTTMRLLLGISAGQGFAVRLIAGKSLARRPMLRVTGPLRKMGAVIHARRSGLASEEYPPVTISGADLRGITYRMPIASAQVKSAILLAGLYASGKTEVREPVETRDHTERALRLAGAPIHAAKNSVTIKKARVLKLPAKLFVPGDISSASFFMVLAAILADSEISIKNVSLNPSRMGVVNVLKRMGARIQVKVAARSRAPGAEPMGDITVKSSRLKGALIKRKEIPSLIDELPILMVAASFADSQTAFEGAGELRVKETDRIRSMSYNLGRMGVKVKVVRKKNTENIVVHGVGELKGAKVRSFGDHRTAMSMIVAGLAASGKTVIDDVSCIDKSFPGFLSVLRPLIN